MKLSDYITDHLQTPFQWGTHDCICFVVGWLELATGKDYLSQFKPWDSARSAVVAIERAGGLAHQFDLHLTRIDPNFATDGCVTIIDRTAYLFSGAYLVSVGEEGLQYRKRGEATCAWHC